MSNSLVTTLNWITYLGNYKTRPKEGATVLLYKHETYYTARLYNDTWGTVCPISDINCQYIIGDLTKWDAWAYLEDD
jgi:hypothetical protein